MKKPINSLKKIKDAIFSKSSGRIKLTPEVADFF
jgi:hypothetical protein